MKAYLKALFCAILVFLLGYYEQVFSAVTVSDITKTQFDSLLSTYDASFSVVFRGGGDGGFGSEEIQIARNTSTPQLGGGSNTVIGDIPSNNGVRWSQPLTDLEVIINASSNISARAASTTVTTLDWAITRPTTQVLILVADKSFFGQSQLTSNVLQGTNFRNLFADNFGPPYQYDAVAISGLTGNEFTYKTNWTPGPYPGFDDQYVLIVGLNNTAIIPEPSTIILLTSISALFVLNRRRI